MDKLKWTYYINCILAVLQIPFSLIHIWSGARVPVGSSLLLTDTVPASFSFLIWWVIFITSIYYSFSLLRLGKKEYESVAKRSALAFALIIIWMIAVQVRSPIWFMPLILIGAYSALLRAYFKGLHLVEKQHTASCLRMAIPMGVYAGWIGLILFVNASLVLEASGIAVLRLAPPEQSAFLIFCATLLSLFVIYRAQGEPSYAAAFVWGLIGIVIAHFRTIAGDIALLSVVAVLLVAATLRYVE